MKKLLLPALLTIWFVFPSLAQTLDICHHDKILSSDSMGGRKPGTKGIAMAADYIQKYFDANHLTMMFDNGFQYFEVTTGIKLGSGNSFNCDGIEYKPETDYVPVVYSNDTAVNGAVVFAGYGFSISTDSLKWDDYKDLDVKNKWVMALRGNPDVKGKNPYGKYSSDRSKMILAKDKGASGLILVSSAGANKKDALLALPSDKNKSKSGFSVINITRKMADQMLAKSGKTIEALENTLNEKKTPNSFDCKTSANVALKFEPVNVKTANVVCMLKSQQKTDNYIVIGGHYDHLGLGGQGSGSRKPDTVAVHHGADDNASGTSTVLDLAARFSAEKLNGDYNIIFVTFSAEEMGLLGSAWFVQHPPVDLKKIKLMINYDMVGRLNAKNTLSVGGVGTFPDAEKILKQDVDTNQLKLSFSKEGYGPSDHASFYGDSIPVLYFNTGVHGDYHTPEDVYGKINCNGMHLIADYTMKVIKDIMKNHYDLTYHEAGPKTRTSERSGLKVTLGIMPDFSNSDIKGVMAAGVNPEGPAFRGGMLKGDIVVGMNGKPVNDIYEYMERLKNFSAGQTITVDVIRNQKKVVLLIQL